MENFSEQLFKSEKIAQIKEDEYELEDNELETDAFELTTDYSRKVYKFEDQQLTLFYKAVFRGTLISENIDYTGHMLWPGSHTLMLFILSNSRFFEGKRVLELGSGSGLTGLWTAKFCKEIILTDCEDTVLDLINFNITKNKFPNENPKVKKLWWGQEVERFIKENGTFDIILGADIIYPSSGHDQRADSERNVLPLFETVRDILKASQTERSNSPLFILSYVTRKEQTTKKFEEAYPQVGLERVSIPYTFFMDKTPSLGAQVYVFRLKK